MTQSGGPTGRLFIAVPLPGRQAHRLHTFAQKLERLYPGNYVPEENYHVTLAFIGEAPLRLSKELAPFLRGTAAAFPAFSSAFSELGFFGSRRSAILWTGLENGAGLLPLADALRAGLRERGVPFDAKAVRPHITIARKVNLEGADLPQVPAEAGRMDTVTLFHSTRVQGRLMYLPLVQVPLG